MSGIENHPNEISALSKEFDYLLTRLGVDAKDDQAMSRLVEDFISFKGGDVSGPRWGTAAIKNRLFGISMLLIAAETEAADDGESVSEMGVESLGWKKFLDKASSSLSARKKSPSP